MHDLSQIIHAEAAASGGIPFHRFMELALYCPEYGFYEADEDRVGRGGDFFTSVSVGPLFGELFAFQFANWLAAAGGGPLQLIEAGAHDGRLAADVLGWLKTQRPEVFARTDYIIMEPSRRRQGWQQQRLAQFGGKVQWAKDWSANASGDQTAPVPFTLIFANELLDALPVRRFGWDAGSREWFEWGVASEAGRLVWTRLPLADAMAACDLPAAPELLAVMPDGFTVERCPAAEAWWGAAAQALRRGKLVTFDYGFAGLEPIRPTRPHGTLRAYRQHRHCEDVLADPGWQDLTAHVEFARIEAVGLAAGLVTDALETQGRWLTRVAAAAMPPTAGFGEWTPSRVRQLQTLTHPQHLGYSFHVLVQSRS